VADDPVRIAQFWQAVEIFSPQSLPRLDQRNHTVDYQDGDRVPWGPRSLLPEPDPGHVWRHEVYRPRRERGLVMAVCRGRTEVG
jgi:hypothetical protein